MADSGDSYSKSDFNAEHLGFDITDLEDAFAIDFTSPQRVVVDIDVGGGDWENSMLLDLVAIQYDQSDLEHVTTDDLEETLTDILMVDVDVTEPQLGGGRGICASKNLVENLPLVYLRKEDSIMCAICRDEIEGGEIANKLPCSHFYHRACIVPWLEINHTCPVCRYELPTEEQNQNELED